jgi:prepilin-type N-terminal cleavage/methylation domain-containing protein
MDHRPQNINHRPQNTEHRSCGPWSVVRGPCSRGFTLIELLVSIGIFTLITTISVFNNAQFNSNVLLTNLAYEVALSVRQAQFYGISVRQNTSDSSKYDSGYGIRFDRVASPTSYILYEDVKSGVSPNHIKDAGDTDIETFTLQKGNRITKVCVDGDCTTHSRVDITFVRPNPDAYIRASDNTSTAYGKAEVCVASPAGAKRKVVVESTGQISVSTDASPLCD